MDRSFLSQPEVVAASRRFVCIRLATYENRAEAELLKSIFIGRSGQLENTVFAILSPDGKRKLTRTGRSPSFAFGGSESLAALEMAETMNRIADRYRSSRTTPADKLPLPTIENTRLALNVAACDRQPLVVVLSSDDRRRAQLVEQVRTLAWSSDFLGQFVYVTEKRRAALSAVKGIEIEEGVIVVAPGQFGQTGSVLAQLKRDELAERLPASLAFAGVAYERIEQDTRNHIRQGRQQRVYWKTLLPVTDPGR